MKVIYNKFIPFKGFSAINLLGVVFARKEYEPVSEQTLNHEAIHTAQMKELLFVGFYLWYVLEWLIKLCFYGKRAYYEISFEREAYDKMRYFGYLSFRKKYSFLKYIRNEKN
ncbi:hypothetical protein FACS189451_07880 [Bacteroidia bacterium]|nr:hypothetical protein FACS189451_07880 [Bacteroidia bacterium]